MLFVGRQRNMLLQWSATVLNAATAVKSNPARDVRDERDANSTQELRYRRRRSRRAHVERGRQGCGGSAQPVPPTHDTRRYGRRRCPGQEIETGPAEPKLKADPVAARDAQYRSRRPAGQLPSLGGVPRVFGALPFLGVGRPFHAVFSSGFLTAWKGRPTKNADSCTQKRKSRFWRS
jgi:hypothetical protein